jgi:hypothetical protein
MEENQVLCDVCCNLAVVPHCKFHFIDRAIVRAECQIKCAVCGRRVQVTETEFER